MPRMGERSSGNARRECYASRPLVRMTNTFMLPGQHTPEDIIGSVKNGIYCVDFAGGEVDITSGQFVFSTSEAYRIENGKITTNLSNYFVGDGLSVLKQVSMVVMTYLSIMARVFVAKMVKVYRSGGHNIACRRVDGRWRWLIRSLAGSVLTLEIKVRSFKEIKCWLPILPPERPFALCLLFCVAKIQHGDLVASLTILGQMTKARERASLLLDNNSQHLVARSQ